MSLFQRRGLRKLTFPTPINYQIVITGYTGDKIRRLSDLRKLFPYEQLPDIKLFLEGKLIQVRSTEEAFKLIKELEENFSFIMGAKNEAIGPINRGCASKVIPEGWWTGMSQLKYKEEEIKKVQVDDDPEGYRDRAWSNL